MGQILHGGATTTHAVRAAIQRSKPTIADLSAQHGVNPKTVMKWRSRSSVEDLPMVPKEVCSTALTNAEVFFGRGQTILMQREKDQTTHYRN